MDLKPTFSGTWLPTCIYSPDHLLHPTVIRKPYVIVFLFFSSKVRLLIHNAAHVGKGSFLDSELGALAICCGGLQKMWFNSHVGIFMKQKRDPGWLGYVGDYTSQYRD